MKTKIIFMNLGTKGDLYPFVGMARELLLRGHPVMVMSSEDRRPLCEAEGIEFAPIQTSEEVRHFVEHPDVLRSPRGLHLYLQTCVLATAERAFQAVADQAALGPCALVCNSLMLGGLMAAEKFDLPCAGVFLQPYGRVSLLDPARDKPLHNWAMDAVGPWLRAQLVRGYVFDLNRRLQPINRLRQKVGLSPIKDIMGEWRNSPALLLDLWPEWFRPAVADWPTQARRTGFVTYDGPARDSRHWVNRLCLEHFLEQRPIVFTMGSDIDRDFASQAKLFAAVCARTKRPGLMISGRVRGVHDIHDNFRIVEPVPFQEIFPHARTLVLHGGIGTVARGLAAGRPMLIAPQVNDQFDNAHRIEVLGVGQNRPFKNLNRASLEKCLSQLDDPEYARAAAKAASLSRGQDGTAGAADLIQERLCGLTTKFKMRAQ